MPTPTIPVEGASTVARKWLAEINIGSAGSPNWAMLEAIETSQFNPDNGNLEDDSSYTGGGYTSQTKSAAAWAYTATLSRKTIGGNPTAYGVAQEFLRLKAIGQFGPANSVQVRIFEYDVNDPTGVSSPRVEAYMGFAGVTWEPAGGSVTALDTVAVNLFGQGKLSVISHPYPIAAAVPVIGAISPAALAAAGGDPVVITGYGFTGTTGASHVTFGGTNATSYHVINDSTIVAVAPAHSAGTVAVVVTNPTGASTTGPSVTYA